MKPKPPFVPPGPPEPDDVRAIREAFERELESVKVAEAAKREELRLQVRRLKRDLAWNTRVLAKTTGKLDELELEREERLAREASGRKRA